MLNRRGFLAASATAIASQTFLATEAAAADKSADFKLKYILATPMYGYAPLAGVVPEATKVGATHIDIWPKVHGNQREQLDEMGEEAFAKLLADHKVKLGCITQYKLGPFGLQGEMKLAQRLGCQLLVCGGRGPKDAKGKELKAAVGKFIEQLKPHLAVAEETGTTIAIENHGNNLIDSPDSLKWLAELRPSKHLGIAFAPYHLPQDEKLQADLIRTLGNSIRMFYAWEHGMGCHVKLPKEQELMQMPGRGTLDFAPLLAALRDVKYDGWSEIFMHPVPRGVPILDSTEKITAEINRSRKYLAERLGSI
jgi:sugar phosphate isomerase/epimerase